VKRRLKLLEAAVEVAAVDPMVLMEVMETQETMETLTLETQVQMLIQQTTVVFLLLLEILIPSLSLVVAP
jgi:hypothetical protein